MISPARDRLLSFSTTHHLALSRILLLAVILAGFFIRVHDLEGQSMWTDEGLTLYRARLPISEILQNLIIVDGIETTDTNPPFYFLLLHLWRSVAGETVFMLRYFGVAAATFSIPLIYSLGSITFGRRAGLIAGLLLAISPFHVWQSQVLRNYGFLITLNLLSVYGLFRYVLASRDRRRVKWLIIWAVAGLIGIYSHYFAFFIFAFGCTALVIDALYQWGFGRFLRSKWFWIGLGVILLFILPAGYVALGRFRAGQQIDYFYVPVGTVAKRALNAFAVGMARDLLHPWWRVFPGALLAVAGLIFGWWANRRATLLLLGYQLIPLGLLLSLSLINPLYNGTRHLLIGLPPFILFMAEGINGPFQDARLSKHSLLRRVISWIVVILGVLIVFIQINWLQEQFYSPDLIRDDVRGAAKYLNMYAEADDLIVVHDTLIRFTFDYYYEADNPVISIPDLGQLDSLAAIDELKSLAKPGQRIWFLAEPTPRNGIEREALIEWADDNWKKTVSRSFPHMWLRVRLNSYLTDPTVTTLPQTATPLDVVWEDVLKLHGYDEVNAVKSGNDLWLTFYLSQLQVKPEQYTLSLRLIDENGQEWAQIDDVIASGFPPTSDEINVITRYEHDVKIPAGIPPGQYAVWMRLVETNSGRAIPLAGDGLDNYLTDITIQPAMCVEPKEQVQADFYPNTRFGDELELAAYSWRQADEIRPGHRLPLKVWWCTDKTPAKDYRLRLQLVNDDGQVIGESLDTLSRPDHLPTEWIPGELLMGIGGLDVPAWTEAGEYEVRLSILEPDSDIAVKRGWWPLGSDYLPLGTVTVSEWPMEIEPPPVASLVGADFGNPPLISLLGYDLKPDHQVKRNESLELDSVWRSLSDRIPVSFSIFLHLADDDEGIISQGDGYPVDGSRPTTSWRENEIIVDRQALIIPADAEPGQYNLWIGFYDPITGQRLPVSLAGEQQADDRLLLQKVTVTE